MSGGGGNGTAARVGGLPAARGLFLSIFAVFSASFCIARKQERPPVHQTHVFLQLSKKCTQGVHFSRKRPKLKCFCNFPKKCTQGVHFSRKCHKHYTLATPAQERPGEPRRAQERPGETGRRLAEVVTAPPPGWVVKCSVFDTFQKSVPREYTFL